MTENEAREFLGRFSLDRIGYASGKGVDTERFNYFTEVLMTAIQALTEIQQYRAIGTIEECREARERQIPKKTKIWTTPDDGVNLIYDMYKCPNCGEEHKIDYYCEYSYYCPNCGQAVKLFE